MFYQFITDDSELVEFCDKIQNASYLALDTEFIRTQTYYPHLALLQVYDGENLALIDPLTITNWQALIAILNDHQIEKFLHACSEDIEVFAYHFGFIPTNIWDSQILAAFLDNSLSSGYATLVDKYLKIKLDKSETRTNWLQRPLTDKQCQYAANDVFYLYPLMKRLKAMLAEQGWLTAAYDECNNMIKRRCHIVDDSDAYLQIKNAWQLGTTQLGYLKKLASWRVNYARTHDIALNFVIHQDVLLKLAQFQPKSLAELSVLGMKGKQLRLYGDKILAILKSAPEPVEAIKRISNFPDYKFWNDLIKQSANEIAIKTGLNVDLLISKRLIEQFINWQHQKDNELPELLTNWRGQLFKSYLVNHF